MYTGYIARALGLPGDPDALKEHAWCNFEFLLARLHSSSVHALLNDLDLTLASVLDADVHLVLKAVASSTRVLATDALQLASELIGRLRQLTGELQPSVSVRPTSVPRGILIHPTVWPQYTNVTRQDRTDRTDNDATNNS